MQNINIGILIGLIPLFVGCAGFAYLAAYALYQDYQINKRNR